MVPASLLLFAACKKSDSVPPNARLKIHFSNEANGQPIVLGTGNYVNAAGNHYNVDLLKYYISNVILVRADSTEYTLRNYDLVNAAVPESETVILDSVVNGDYIGIKFYMGVDQTRNHTGAQDGALDPINGMIWTWNTGYIFFKHEGNFTDSNGTTRPLTLHFGTDLALTQAQIAIPKLSINGADRTLSLKLNLDSVYAAVARIDFNTDNNRQSTSLSDRPWLMNMNYNFTRSFQYVKAD